MIVRDDVAMCEHKQEEENMGNDHDHLIRDCYGNK